jgi:hypothetical protein
LLSALQRVERRSDAAPAPLPQPQVGFFPPLDHPTTVKELRQAHFLPNRSSDILTCGGGRAVPNPAPRCRSRTRNEARSAERGAQRVTGHANREGAVYQDLERGQIATKISTPIMRRIVIIV